MEDMLKYENYYYDMGCINICGVDEAGRGPLAGPVCAAAVILPRGLVIEQVNDSKKLTEKKREMLFDIIKEKAAAYNIAWASVEEIESMNILNATMLAMKRAVEGLPVKAGFALIDGDKRPRLDIPCVDVVKGDSLSESIAAASILAKVSRDRQMVALAEKYPEYGFEKHKGYASEFHRNMIREHGPSEIHRLSFLGGILHPEQKKTRTKAQLCGINGEDDALRYLTGKGYELVVRNFRAERGEIDIIMKDGGDIVFVEVKARDINSLARPSESVTLRKQKKLIQTALIYMQKTSCGLQPRFDIVEVVYDPAIPEPAITHFENAFSE